MASLEEAGKRLGQICVACGWQNITSKVAELTNSKNVITVAFALFTKNKDGEHSYRGVLFDCSEPKWPNSWICEDISGALESIGYKIPDFKKMEIGRDIVDFYNKIVLPSCGTCIGYFALCAPESKTGNSVQYLNQQLKILCDNANVYIDSLSSISDAETKMRKARKDYDVNLWRDVSSHILLLQPPSSEWIGHENSGDDDRDDTDSVRYPSAKLMGVGKYDLNDIPTPKDICEKILGLKWKKRNTAWPYSPSSANSGTITDGFQFTSRKPLDIQTRPQACVGGRETTLQFMCRYLQWFDITHASQNPASLAYRNDLRIMLHDFSNSIGNLTFCMTKHKSDGKCQNPDFNVTEKEKAAWRTLDRQLNLLYRELDWDLSRQSRSQGKTEKERTDKTLPSEKELGKRLKDLNKNIYYSCVSDAGEDTRLFFCSDKLTGPDIIARAKALDQPELLNDLRKYFRYKFNVLSEDKIVRLYNHNKSHQGAFFLHAIKPADELKLISALYKMGVPSDDEYHTRKVTVKMPKRKK